MIESAPIQFIIAVAFVAVVIWIALSWKYRTQIEHLNARIMVLEERIKAKDEDLAKYRHQVSRQVVGSGIQVEPARIDLVYPFIRYAYHLENYDGSTEKAGNENRMILESSPPVKLHYFLYSESRPAWFDFGVANLNEKAPIDNVVFVVGFLDDGLRITAGGHWATDVPNAKFSFQFRSVNARSALNGDGGLSVIFPSRGNYTIRLAINARGLGEKIRDLPVIVG